MEENKSPKLPGLPSFTGGLVGYFSYDYIKYSEPTLRLDAKDEEGFQDVNLMLFHKVIAFDNYRQKLILILNIKTDDLEINYHRAERELNNMKGQRFIAVRVIVYPLLILTYKFTKIKGFSKKFLKLSKAAF